MAEVKITITAEDGTQQTFRAISEGSKSAFDSVSSSAKSAVEKQKKTEKNRVRSTHFTAFRNVSSPSSVKSIDLIPRF